MIRNTKQLDSTMLNLTRWQAVLTRDTDADGRFWYGVITTGIYCRPHCASRHAKRENVRFFETREEARAEGLRPCKRCRPDVDEGK
jgi:methylphosphotriester-DNA--protein-cysteine methyltransferase